MPDILELARECGGIRRGSFDPVKTWDFTETGLLMLERRIREDERERCAKLIESTIRQGQLQGTGWDALAQRNGQILACNVIRTGRPETAAAIRRGGDHG